MRQEGYVFDSYKMDLLIGALSIRLPLNALRKRFTAWKAKGKPHAVEKHHPRPADELAEETIEEAQRKAEDEVDPEERARIERAQREADELVDRQRSGDLADGPGSPTLS